MQSHPCFCYIVKIVLHENSKDNAQDKLFTNENFYITHFMFIKAFLIYKQDPLDENEFIFDLLWSTVVSRKKDGVSGSK